MQARPFWQRASRALLLAMLMLAPADVVPAQAVDPDTRVKPLLPGPGKFACFTGTYTGRTMDIADWSKEATEPREYEAPDGTRGVTKDFPREKNVPVHTFTLRLDYDSRKASYDWIFNFTLVARTGKTGLIYARGECPWHEKVYIDKDIDYRVEANTTHLYCGIDCDGGGMSLSRIPGSKALTISFDAMGLLMKKGCGGGGHFRVHANASGGDFRLEPAPASACRGLKSLQ